MSRLRTLLEWCLIAIPFIVIGYLIFGILSGSSLPAVSPSGLPDGTGGFWQEPLSSRQQEVKTAGNWQFTLLPTYRYTLAGKVVGRHEYPDTLPDGIIPLDLAVVNGELIQPDILSYFTFTMGDHTLKYDYDIPTYTGLTEKYIDEHVSNNHLVFTNSTLERDVRKAEVGSCLVIRGRLVDIRGASPVSRYSMDTSTVRNDSYPAGCEIILVDSYTPVSCGE
jgi:hypothetical protein